MRKNSGGRWRYDLTFEAGEPAPDDVIYLEAPIHKTAQVQFKLCNAFDDDAAAYTAYFSTNSASVFSVNPMQGVLSRAGTAGALFTVAYTPAEYGKPVRGTLIILTEEMQWSYEVRGGHPPYEIPRVAHSTIDHVLDPSISMRLGKVPTTNFMKKNMQQQHRGDRRGRATTRASRGVGVLSGRRMCLERPGRAPFIFVPCESVASNFAFITKRKLSNTWRHRKLHVNTEVRAHRLRTAGAEGAIEKAAAMRRRAARVSAARAGRSPRVPCNQSRRGNQPVGTGDSQLEAWNSR